MIVLRLRLAPFGCFSDRELRFSPGLNVVHGPNETGKSTLFRAIRHALFVPVKLSKPGHEKYVAPYLPVSGGDTLGVELDFQVGGGAWKLTRRWGASAGSALVLPTGALLADDAAVQEKLTSLLPARPGTFASILMTGQAELAGTIESLKKEPGETLADLADLLQKAVLETGGVSIDRFRAVLDARISDAFSHWDRSRGCPEGNRGIENPWKKEVGSMLRAWYERERNRSALRAALAWEKDLDALNSRLREASAARAARESFVQANRQAAEGARERRALEAEIAKARLGAESLRKAGSEWPAAEEKGRGLQEAIAALEAGIGPLEQEMRDAQREEESRTLREARERVARHAAQAKKAREALAACPRLEKAALEEIRNASARLREIAAGVEAGKLSVAITGKASAPLVVQEDLAPEREKMLGPGETVRFRAGSRFRIAHPDMEIEIRSGTMGPGAAAEDAAAAQRALSGLLSAHGVAGLAEAEERNRAYETALAVAAAAEKNLAEELGGETLEAFEARAAALGPSPPARPPAAIAGDLADRKARRETMLRDLRAARELIDGWRSEFKTPEALVDRLAEARREERELSERISRCSPLPDGFADPALFLREYEDAREELARRVEERNGLLVAKAALDARAPEQSAEELTRLLEESGVVFESASRRGEALARIRNAADGLLAGSDSAVYGGMEAELGKMVAAMTGGRHTGVALEGALPRSLAQRDGMSLGWDLLSAGTRDTLALALRLAMARRFLGSSPGFLVMDDPLVDMDPDRQQAAAAALREFAAGTQLIVFTCHPDTAALLGGNLIAL